MSFLNTFVHWLLIIVMIPQAFIQDFAQGGATAKRDPEARGPRYPLTKTKLSVDVVHGAHSAFYFIILLFYFILFATRGGTPPPCPLGYVTVFAPPTFLGKLHPWLLSDGSSFRRSAGLAIAKFSSASLNVVFYLSVNYCYQLMEFPSRCRFPHMKKLAKCYVRLRRTLMWHYPLISSILHLWHTLVISTLCVINILFSVPGMH